jgi:hypothetical protein
MKKPALTLFILVFSLPILHAQKVRYGQGLPKAKPGVDYPLSLHISAMRLGSECSITPLDQECADVLHADAVVSGKKIELESDFNLYLQFARDIKSPLLGDYRARILTKNPGADLDTIGLRYELLLPDGSVLKCRVTGISE